LDVAVVNDDDDNDAYKAEKGCQQKGIPLLSSEIRLAVACSGVTADDLAAAADLVAGGDSSNEGEEPCCPNTVANGPPQCCSCCHLIVTCPFVVFRNKAHPFTLEMAAAPPPQHHNGLHLKAPPNNKRDSFSVFLPFVSTATMPGDYWQCLLHCFWQCCHCQMTDCCIF